MTPSDEPPAPFFASSDDEDSQEKNIMDVDDIPEPMETARSSPSLPQTPQTTSSRSSPAVDKLFLEDSDDETSKLSENTFHAAKDESLDFEILQEAPLPGRSEKSRSTSFLQEESSPPSHPKKRRLSEDSKQGPLSTEEVVLPAYLGEIIVPNAWSNVSGKGYVKINDTILIRREEDAEEAPVKSKGSTTSNKKKKVDNKKQMKLSSMLKNQSAKGTKKKKDTIVRLVNKSGFEFGRLPTETSWWVSKLLELGMVEIRGVMTDCPERLSTGISLIVALRFYLLPAAFRPIRSSGDGENPVHFAFNEGLETEEESSMRERKKATVKLLDVLDLRPQAGAGVNVKGKKSEAKIRDEALKRMKPGKKVKEIVGDGEEIEVDDAEELSKSEIDSIYNRAQQHDRTMASMEPADTFNMTLRGYQKQALFWMHSLETGSLDAREASSMHPLWSQYVFPQPPVGNDEMIDLTADEKLFYFNPYSGEMSLTFPKAERTCKGGILADVGMGKTIMLSALIQTSLATKDSEDDSKVDGPSRAKQLRLNSAFRPVVSRKNSSSKPPAATLIVAPTSLLNQWAEELERSSKPGTFQICVWHGSNRADLEAMLDDDDNDDTEDKPLKTVITSYGVLASEHAKLDRMTSSRPPVFDITWWRVILDEAHSCKSRTSKTAKAVYALSAKRKWAVTGTPIVNRLEDLYSLLKFLDFKPWSEFSFFRSFITIPFLASDPKAIEVVQIILESILLRREKTMRDTDGNRIVELPPKEIVVEQLEFSPLERKIYDSIYHSAKLNFEQLDAKGLVGKNYTHILAMLMRLRRAVLHPNLVLTKDDERALSPTGDAQVDVNDLIKRFADGEQSTQGESTSFAEEFIANLKGDELGECPICFSEMESPMIVPGCMHQFCKDCIVSHIGICEERKQQPNCPTCNAGPLEAAKLVEIVRKDAEAPSSSQASDATISFRRNDFQSSTKLDALVQSLRKLRAQDPCFRAVVFSQFTSFLDLIELALDRDCFEHHRFDGTMDVKKKSAAISEFKSPSRKPKVLVISLKAGGVGLNLTTANHVFMMDCWWNAAVEHQAIDRVHRIGQEKTVYVTHFIVRKTIEKRIIRIQKRKTAIVNEAFRGSSKADPQSLQNLKIMFGADDEEDDED